jgi:hypothetical protein
VIFVLDDGPLPGGFHFPEHGVDLGRQPGSRALLSVTDHPISKAAVPVFSGATGWGQ